MNLPDVFMLDDTLERKALLKSDIEYEHVLIDATDTNSLSV